MLKKRIPLIQPATTATKRTQLASWCATVAGLGYFPLAPGTAGALAACGAGYLTTVQLGVEPPLLLLALPILVLAAVWSSEVYSRSVDVEDPPEVIMDEFAGQWIVLATIDANEGVHWVVALLAFRLFDIWKPYPVKRAERLPGGWGIVADDLVAGLLAAVVVLLLRWSNWAHSLFG